MGFSLSVILLIGLRFVGIFLALALARLAHRPCLWLGSRHAPAVMETVAWVCEFCNGTYAFSSLSTEVGGVGYWLVK